MSIGSIIKKIRREQDMTQEQLADLLGITSAAVSGWECDRNAPDISQIPLLCRIFGVSSDVLLDIDLSAQESKIDAIIIKAESTTAKEAISMYRNGLAEFPASYRLMLSLADKLDDLHESETYDARIAEQIALYEKVREVTKDPYLKNLAEGRLCVIYLQQGKREKALKIAETVPHFLYPRKELDKMLAQGIDKIHEMHHTIHEEFATLCDDIYVFTMQQVEGKPFFTHKQAIIMLEKIPKFYEIFYENGDYLSANGVLAWAYTRMAEHYADMEDGENTVMCIEFAAKYAYAMDAYNKDLHGVYGFTDVWDYPQFPLEKRHTSILATPELDYPTSTLFQGENGEESCVNRLKRDVTHTRFDFVRNKISILL